MMGGVIRKWIFYSCAMILVVSAALYITSWEIIPYIYAVAGAGVAVIYLTPSRDETNQRLRRLMFQQTIAAVLLPVSSFLMFKQRNEWFLALFVSAVLQLYIIIVKIHEGRKK
ncbi:MAG: hypothetical protein LBS54_01340 [Dysgonamonadaceae bacterium]|jgi:hypothetical protein|nr:hypothetical protein [Dysgonamonadaceae bacterium]